jgi:hypothetical protein
MSDEPDDDQPKRGPWDILRTDRPPGLGDPRRRAQFLKKLRPPWEIRRQPSHLHMWASNVAHVMAEEHPEQCPLPDNIRLTRLVKALGPRGIDFQRGSRDRINERRFLIGGPWRKLFRQLWPSASFHRVQDRVRLAGPYFTFCQWMCRVHGFEKPKDVSELRACQMAVNRLKRVTKPKGSKPK